MARVLDEALADMPVDEDSNYTSDEDNLKIINGEEYHNDKIPSEDVYHRDVNSK